MEDPCAPWEQPSGEWAWAGSGSAGQGDGSTARQDQERSEEQTGEAPSVLEKDHAAGVEAEGGGATAEEPPQRLPEPGAEANPEEAMGAEDGDGAEASCHPRWQLLAARLACSAEAGTPAGSGADAGSGCGITTLEIPQAWAEGAAQARPERGTPERGARSRGKTAEGLPSPARGASPNSPSRRWRSSSRPARAAAEAAPGRPSHAAQAWREQAPPAPLGPRHGHGHGGPLVVALWVGPLPLPQCKDADERELLGLLDGLQVHRIEMHQQCAYVFVPANRAWEVRVRVTNRTIRNGPRLSARERVDAANWVPIQVSPLEVAFSQREIPDRFRDGIALEDSVAQTQVTRLTEGWSLLEPPFAPMRVVADGHRFLALNNRRLYVLQRRAAELWPRPSVANVLLCDGQVPSEHWAMLATRETGDRVDVLSAVPSPGASLPWAQTTKWRRAWSCEDAVAEAEMRTAAAGERSRRDQAWASWGQAGSRWADAGPGSAWPTAPRGGGGGGRAPGQGRERGWPSASWEGAREWGTWQSRRAQDRWHEGGSTVEQDEAEPSSVARDGNRGSPEDKVPEPAAEPGGEPPDTPACDASPPGPEEEARAASREGKDEPEEEATERVAVGGDETEAKEATEEHAFRTSWQCSNNNDYNNYNDNNNNNNDDNNNDDNNNAPQRGPRRRPSSDRARASVRRSVYRVKRVALRSGQGRSGLPRRRARSAAVSRRRGGPTPSPNSRRRTRRSTPASRSRGTGATPAFQSAQALSPRLSLSPLFGPAPQKERGAVSQGAGLLGAMLDPSVSATR